MSSGWGSDLRVASVGVMVPFLPGMLVLLGLMWLGGFGVVLGLAAAVWWGVWWYRKHDGFFPKDVQGAPYVITIILTLVSFFIVLGSI